MIFFKKKNISYKGYNIPQNESCRISLSSRLLTMTLMIFSGILLSTAFPPVNWEILAYIAAAPLIIQSLKNPVSWKLFSYGWLWGVSWSFCAYFWLREINPFIPFALSAIIGLWGGAFALLTSFAARRSLCSDKNIMQDFKSREKNHFKWFQGILFAIFCGCFFVMLEYIRIKLFPWNFIGVTQYKMIYLIQIVNFTGIYGISFLIIGMNAALALLLSDVMKKIHSKDVEFSASFCAAGFFVFLIAAACIYGYFRCKKVEKDYFNGRKIRFGIVQGDISQRRVSTTEMAKEALDIYLGLSEKLALSKPDIIIWPETAVPYPYYGGNIVSAQYRSGVYNLTTKNNIPLLTGTLDFIITGKKTFEMTNSAFLIGADGIVKDKYAKINRVPFGEFVPFRQFLSENIIRKVGMGRDLTAGNDASPIEILPGVRAGMAVCYESIFASLARDEANLGANILIAINNDAWYPESSEPEQHAANAVFRAVENNLPALRSGNNGASSLILPSGRIGWSLSGHLLNRERKTGIAEVFIKEKTDKTFYTKHGDYFLLLLFTVGSAAILYGLYQYFYMLYILKNKKNEAYNEI